MTEQSEHSSYDEVPYHGMAYSHSHLDHLAAIGSLMGLHVAPVVDCQVLELGCADGSNLIPMASAFPLARFVGIDRSEVQIGMGRALIAQLGLSNITLYTSDILEIGPELGQFDYIVAHGVYSWVPPIVREALLGVCSRNLARNGIAYVSYNAYPGWHLFEPIRAMLLYQTAHIRDPLQRLAQARELLELLTVEQSSDDILNAVVSLSATILKKALESATLGSDASILLHDIMEDNNQPIYFHEFAAHARQFGLQYLAEANFPTVFPRGLSKPVNEHIRKMATTGIDVEQYLDFFNGRTFRQTLLCHDQITPTRMLRPTNLMRMAISSRAVVEGPEVDLQPGVVVRYRSRDGATFLIDTPVSKAGLLLLLNAWPRAVPFEELLDLAIERITAAGIPIESRAAAATQLATDLLTAFCYSEQLANVHICPPAVAHQLSECPIAWPLARIQAAGQGPLTTLYHENVDADQLTRQLIQRFDGTHDRLALLHVAEQLIAAGTLPADQDFADTLEATIEGCLRWALWSGLLSAA